MSEHELTTMLRDHLADEPPVSVTSAAAIRTARRQSRLRTVLAGGAAVVALGMGAVTVPGLLSDDGRGTAHEPTGAADSASGTYTDRVVAVAQDELGQYLDLGTPQMFVTDVDVVRVPTDSPDVQSVGATYDLGGTVVDVDVMGFAPDEFGTFRVECNPDGSYASCEPGSLPDGSTYTTQIDSFQQTDAPGAMRYRSPAWAAAHPDDVFFGRAVQVSTPSGLNVYVAEYVKAASLDDVRWSIPAEALRSVATDPTVLDPTGVAHSPVCQSAHTSC
jgi:hypothetical protein